MAKPWPYIGPWLLALGTLMKPLSCVLARMKSTQRSTLLAVRPAARRAAGRHERHAGQSAHRHVAAVPAGAERAVLVLARGQQRQPAIDGLAGGGRDQLGAGLFRLAMIGASARSGPSAPAGQLGSANALAAPPARPRNMSWRRLIRSFMAKLLDSAFSWPLVLTAGQNNSSVRPPAIPSSAAPLTACSISRSVVRTWARTARATTAASARDRGVAVGPTGL